jgi:hypothetical protein
MVFDGGHSRWKINWSFVGLQKDFHEKPNLPSTSEITEEYYVGCLYQSYGQHFALHL